MATHSTRIQHLHYFHARAHVESALACVSFWTSSWQLSILLDYLAHLEVCISNNVRYPIWGGFGGQVSLVARPCYVSQSHYYVMIMPRREVRPSWLHRPWLWQQREIRSCYLVILISHDLRGFCWALSWHKARTTMGLLVRPSVSENCKTR